MVRLRLRNMLRESVADDTLTSAYDAYDACQGVCSYVTREREIESQPIKARFVLLPSSLTKVASLRLAA